MNEQFQEKITVSVTDVLKKDIHRYCSKHGIKQSSLIRDAIQKLLEKDVDNSEKQGDNEEPIP